MKLLNKCPICGNPIIYSKLMQYSLDSRIKQNGEISKNAKKSKAGFMDCGFLSCTNKSCDFVTDTDFACYNYHNMIIKFIDGKLYYEYELER